MGMYCHVRAISPEHCRLLAADPDNLEQVLAGRASSVRLEKAWHGLHFLLTGTAWEGDPPLNFLMGGQPIGEDDDGYGPPRLLRPAEVAQLDTALSNLSDAQLWSRFDAEQMEAEEIYPGIWDESEEDLQEEYLHYFHELKRLVHEARTGGKGLLVMLS